MRRGLDLSLLTARYLGDLGLLVPHLPNHELLHDGGGVVSMLRRGKEQ